MIYVCGDSFNTSDTDYPGQSWYDKFANLAGATTNLSIVCASNLLISLQVDCAIKQKASFIIVSFTSVTRSEVCYTTDRKIDNLLDRFYSLTGEDNTCCDLTSYTIWTPNDARALTKEQRKLVEKYNKEFFDLDLAIYKNHIIIDYTLQKLKSSGISFLFDQGGFEHPSYGATTSYFTEYDQYRSKYNLWDYVPIRTFRPYFHITDTILTDQVAQYYSSKVK
jgi:hypothetical protein